MESKDQNKKEGISRREALKRMGRMAGLAGLSLIASGSAMRMLTACASKDGLEAPGESRAGYLDSFPAEEPAKSSAVDSVAAPAATPAAPAKPVKPNPKPRGTKPAPPKPQPVKPSNTSRYSSVYTPSYSSSYTPSYSSSAPYRSRYSSASN